MDRMSLEKFESLIAKELEYWKDSSVPKTNVIRFQNHLYGCIALLESIGEGDTDISETIIRQKHDNVSQVDIDIDAQFCDVGVLFGFLQHSETRFGSWSNDYKNIWIWIWQTLGKEKKLEEIDSIEKKLFENFPFEAFPYFKEALKTGSLPEDLEQSALESINPRTKKETKSRTRRKRAITPILRRRNLRKTHKKKLELHTTNTLEPSNR